VSTEQRTSLRSRVPRLALRPDEAAESIGVSRAFFFESVLPELRVVRRGRLRLVPVVALEEWLDRNASRVVE
jgi:hypothetical protein